MAEKQWKDYTPRERKKAKTILGCLLVFVVLIISIVASNNGESGKSKDNGQTAKTSTEHSVANDVKRVLDGLDEDTRGSLADTSNGGYQGNIVEVKSDGKDSVKISVSTNFSKPGDEDEGGKNIARNILRTICLEVPGLNSLYVTSTSSGLDSQSVYRKQIPACR